LGGAVRIKIGLAAVEGRFLQYNYNYQLSSAIYNFLRFGSKEFSAFLHDSGYRYDGKAYKLFTFALQFEKPRFTREGITLQSPKAYLFVTSAVADSFVQNFVVGAFESARLTLQGRSSPLTFDVTSVESLRPPEIHESMKFKLMSPLVLSTKYDAEDKAKIHYLRYDDPPAEIDRILAKNLTNKFNSIYDNQKETGSVSLAWDAAYIKKRLQENKALSSLTKFEVGAETIEVKGINVPFTLTGDRELIKIGYECGFGEKNSMGFGMAEAV
jgi:CRISPR-associated endoribonuclease Cas6